jgi:hypothetical protein
VSDLALGVDPRPVVGICARSGIIDVVQFCPHLLRTNASSPREEDEMKILRSRGAKAIGLILGILAGLIALILVWTLWVYPAEYVYRVLA